MFWPGRFRALIVPGTDAFIFQLRNALGGGGIASLRIDPQGKAFGQMLLDAPVAVPAAWIERDRLAEASTAAV